jgi:hypothetical protein
MRAPPEQETISSGSFSSAASSIVRVIFSPTTLPIEPIMNVGSMTASAIGRPLMNPRPQTQASFSRLLFCSALRRSLYAFLSTNPSGSAGSRSLNISSKLPGSTSCSIRVRAEMRKW